MKTLSIETSATYKEVKISRPLGGGQNGSNNNKRRCTTYKDFRYQSTLRPATGYTSQSVGEQTHTHAHTHAAEASAPLLRET